METLASIHDYMLIRNFKSNKDLRLIQSFEFPSITQTNDFYDTNFFDLIRRNGSCSLRKNPVLQRTDNYDLFDKSLFMAGRWKPVRGGEAKRVGLER
jgi:hypothetical protein